MACIRKRRGKWIVDFRDRAGRRRWMTRETKAEAREVLAEVIQQARGARLPFTGQDVTLEEYALRWLESLNVRPATVTRYERELRQHIVPELGRFRLSDLTRAHVRAFVLGHSRRAGVPAARHALRVLGTLLSSAVDAELIQANPASRIGRVLPRESSTQSVKAFSRDELSCFLNAARSYEHYALCATLAWSGLRLGEARALELRHVDFERRVIYVERTFSGNEIWPEPKTLSSRRTVQIPTALVNLLREHLRRRQEKILRLGLGRVGWLFVTPLGKPPSMRVVERAFKHVLRRAGLPPHHSPHDLRHTYASLLIQQGEPLAFVQRQLGHSSIAITVDIYGRWLTIDGRAGLERLARSSSPEATLAEVVPFPINPPWGNP